VFFFTVPNKLLNQTLLKPIKPKTFEINNTVIVRNGIKSIKEDNRQNSLINFIEPGRPEKNKIIIIIDIDKLGRV